LESLVNKAKAWVLVVSVLALSGCGDQGGDATQADANNSKQASAANPVHPGKEVYENYCYSCHLTGLSGAPILGDIQSWAPRIAKGGELLLQSTVEGMGTTMPARGMCFDCSDDDLAAAVDYMVVNSQ
jgi:cytochrome c5